MWGVWNVERAPRVRTAICLCVTAAAALALAGCSSEFSRLDYPMFAKERHSSNGDEIVTSALPPVPAEPIYGSSSGYDDGFNYGRNASPAPRRATYSTSSDVVEKPGIVHHKVKRGESLAIIARQYGTSYAEIARANTLTDPDRLQPGDIIEVTNGDSASKQMARSNLLAIPRITKLKTKPVRIASTSLYVPLPAGKPNRQPLPKKQTKARPAKPKKVASIGKLPKPQPMSQNRFRWPVRGRIISRYGAKPNGKHNDGINIAVPQGTSVKAAENGVVAYSGNELKGYGNLILVRHADNWVTAYAHNKELLVKRGEKIRRGQIIAKAGGSGNVSKPQLHFELRKGSRPVDPLKHMAGI